MKIQKVIEIETEVLDGLLERALKGDNEAARIILEFLDRTSKNIGIWKEIQDKLEEAK